MVGEGIGVTFLAFAESSIQLVPDGTLLFHLVLLLIMVAVLSRTMYRPMNRVLAEREDLVQGRVGKAQQMVADVEGKLSAYEKTLRDARSAAYKSVELERTAAVREHEQTLNALREELHVAVSEQRRAIQEQAGEAKRTLAAEALRNAEQIGSKILGRPVRSTDYPIS